MVFVTKGELDLFEEFLFCHFMKTTTTGEDLFTVGNNYFEENRLS